MGMRIVESFADTDIATVKSPFGRRREIQNDTPATSETKSMRAQEQRTMNPEFYLILTADELTEDLENVVFEAGFDDSSLTMRGGRAAIWIRHRQGDFASVVQAALKEASTGGLRVDHVEMDNAAFAKAQ